MTYTSVGIAQMEGFVESLRLLVQFEEYSLTDIGMMFGVSRERIRQLCIRYDIEVPHHGVVSGPTAQVQREWDDDQNRFVPVRRAATLGILFEKEFRRDIRGYVREAYCAHLVAAGLAANARLQRPISAQEWWLEASGVLVGHACVRLILT